MSGKLELLRTPPPEKNIRKAGTLLERIRAKERARTVYSSPAGRRARESLFLEARVPQVRRVLNDLRLTQEVWSLHELSLKVQDSLITSLSVGEASKVIQYVGEKDPLFCKLIPLGKTTVVRLSPPRCSIMLS